MHALSHTTSHFIFIVSLRPLPPHELTHAEHCSSNVVIKKNSAHTNPTHSRRKHTSLSLQQYLTARAYAVFLDLPCKWKSMIMPCMEPRCLFCGSVCIIISQIMEIVMKYSRHVGVAFKFYTVSVYSLELRFH